MTAQEQAGSAATRFGGSASRGSGGWRIDAWRTGLARFLRALEGLEGPEVRSARHEAPTTLLFGDLTVRYGTREFTCLHEAGHAAAAAAEGVGLLLMEAGNVDGVPSGLTRTRPCGDRRSLVALGGYAIEIWLWKRERLAWFDGSPVATAELTRGVARTCGDDRVAYFEEDRRTPDGRWPRDEDQQFFDAAEALAERLDLDVVDRIACALFAQGRLDQPALDALTASGDL